MAGPVKETISIAAPVTTVIGVVADLENTDRWANEAKSAEVVTRDGDGRPTRIVVTLGAIGFTSASTFDVAYTDSSVTLTCVEGRLIAESTISYEAAESGAGTELTMTSTMQVTVPVPQWGLERAMSRSARKNLASVKADAERAVAFG
ncbi:SRPBCC family protein [Actinomycetospora endophytica]|uniref:SRPBCC family protein n=1 Tax=Actinomycetospora endophytica TaxID=2291215 RepID=A0ABS8P6I4_9PSEU|nr:SRPBCC family protein [Actinomycetospora endophytica]MCD2193848.1 SRPBCC family protein [Actinomycetospora endophytica]